MADTINKMKILDDVVAVNSKVNMGVLYGAQNVTSQVFKAISATPSSLIFNVVVPSIETILDRRIMIQSTMILRIDIQNPIAGSQLINYGVADALAPFPLNQLIQSIQCSINNNNITLQQADIFDVLLRMQDPEELARYDGKTPTGLDFLYDYSDGVMMNPYYIDLYNNSGNYQLSFYQSDGIAGGQAGQRTFTSFNNNILSYDMNRIANSSHCHKPRGGYVIDAIFKATSDANAINGTWLPITDGTAGGYYVQFTVTEPLFLSPFLLGLSGKEDHSGIFSVNALNFTINFSQNANRAWRSARFVNPTSASSATPAYQTKTATLIYVSNNSQMFCKFYTPKATMLDNPRCVVPYHEFQIYKTTSQQPLAPILLRTAGDARTYGKVDTFTLLSSSTATLSQTTLTSNNIQLQSIPERLIVFVRRIKDSTLTCCDSDSYLAIQNIRVNFNNQSGLLATFNQQQLYDSTIGTGGIRNLTWEEFSGITLSASGGVSLRFPSLGQYSAAPYNQLSGVGAGIGFTGQAETGLRLVPTTGSIVSLRFGTDIQIPEEFYAPSSIGQFNLQVQVQVANLTKDTWSNYELVVLVENPGVLITDRGSSSTFVGLLTKDAVLQVKDNSDHVTLAYAKHMVGGSIYHSALNGLRWLHQHGVTKAKEWLRDHVNHPIANTAVKTAEALGYGMTGGANNRLQSRLM